MKAKEVELKFNCDVCDKGFKSEEILMVHISEHVKVSGKLRLRW